MADLWDDLPIEMMGERPTFSSMTTKTVDKSTKVEQIPNLTDSPRLNTQEILLPEVK